MSPTPTCHPAHVSPSPRVTQPTCHPAHVSPQEYEKELSGERSGVYVPAKTKRLEEFEVEIPPAWAAPPSVAYAKLTIVKVSSMWHLHASFFC